MKPRHSRLTAPRFEECEGNSQRRAHRSGCNPPTAGWLRPVTAAVLCALAVPGFAQLKDHGPGDAALAWPTWYRDLDNLALGLCKSTATSPNVAGSTMCFPLVPDPAGFAGNLGPEIFYQNLNVDVVSGGIDLRYIAALESAYGNAQGTPIKGQEIVFSRVRFVMAVNAPECAGSYTIIHPFGRNSYNNVPQSKRALFDTFDVPLGALGDFEGALNGFFGPWLRWEDENLGNEVPMPTTDPKLSVGAEQFVGDPNVLHHFTGSPFIEFNLPGDASSGPKYQLGTGGPAHQNYVKVIAPAGCDIGGQPADQGGEGINVFKQPLGLLLGQVWTAPIPTPTRITNAIFSRTGGTIAADVWANTAPNNVLLLTGQGMPSVQMKEDKTAAGAGTGNYHSHIEYSGELAHKVTVTNTTSNPVIQSSSDVVDVVDITGAYYDRSSQQLCVTAHSLDQTGLPQLLLSGPEGVEGVLGSTPCPAPFPPAPDPRDLSLVVTLPNGAPQVTEPASTVTVRSASGGSDRQDVEMGGNTPDNQPGAPVATDDVFSANTGSATSLPVGANDNPANGGAITIISQPANGTATGSAAGGAATYTPAASFAGGADSFTYVVQDTSGRVSNLATVQLTVNLVTQPPTVSGENFAVVRYTGQTPAPSFTANVLANDVAGAGTTIAPGTVTITQQGTRGIATPNPDGTITYKPNLNAAGGADYFLYTVKGVASDGALTAASTAARVDVVVEGSNESVSINRNRFSAGKWDLRFTTSSGWFGGVLTPAGSCYLIKIGNNSVTPALIGSAPVDPTGAVQIQALSGGGVPNPGAKGTNYTIQCATSNHAHAFPSQTNTSDTPTNSTSVN